MFRVLRKWSDQLFASEEALLLLVWLGLSLGFVVWLGHELAPVIASAIIAFVLNRLTQRLVRWGVPPRLALALSFGGFVGGLLLVMLLLLPLVWRQLGTFFTELPVMLTTLRAQLEQLAQRTDLFSDALIGDWIGLANVEVGKMGRNVIAYSLASLPGLITLLIYLVLVPILVFFFLVDHRRILAWFERFLPRERPLMQRVWVEMNQQVSNYVTGKAIEILIVGAVSYVAFVWLALDYAALLALLVGLSVLVPYIGATVVTVPVLLVGYIQWGWSSDFFYLAAVYLIIQILDGNVLVPLLFSEAVNLHPVAIIVAVLVFGGIWGFWGVFFSIPLATLIQAVLSAWPRPGEQPT
jgi:putative permease